MGEMLNWYKKSMTNISNIGMVSPFIYISGSNMVKEAEWLRVEGITNILKLYIDEPYLPEDFNVYELPIEDGVFIELPVLQKGTEFIRQCVEAENKVLVMCGLGVSRSAAFILAYLLENGYDLHEAFHVLRTARPQAWPARQLWESLITHYHAPYSLRVIQGWMKEII